MKRIKPSQAEWHCGIMNKTFKAEMHAYAENGNWLCPCGRFIKDSLHIHRIIRQGDRVPTDNEKILTKTGNSDQILQDYIVHYWMKNGEKTKKMEAYSTIDLKSRLDKMFISNLPYAAFKVMKDQPKNLQVLVN